MQELTMTTIHEAIMETNKELMTRFRSGDVAGISKLYTKDGQVMPPNSDSVTGREEIQTFWQNLLDSGIKEIKLNEGGITGCDDMAAEISTFNLIGENGQLIDSGKYIVLWKNENGDWKLYRDIFNSNLPASTS